MAKLIHQKKCKSKVPDSLKKEELIHQLSSTALNKLHNPFTIENHVDRRGSVEKDSTKKRERSRERQLFNNKDIRERASEPIGKSSLNRLSWFVSPVNGAKSSLNISSEQKKGAKFLRNKSERHLGVDEHRASVEPTEKRELGKSQKINPSNKEPKKNQGLVSSQLETKRLNGGSMIDTRELLPPKPDTKRGKIKGFSKSRRELQSEAKPSSSVEKKKLLKSFKSHITLKTRPLSSIGKQTDRKEKRRNNGVEHSRPKMIDLAKLVKNLRSIHSMRGTMGETSSVAGGEESKRIHHKKHNKPIGKLIKKKNKKPAGPANISLATKLPEPLKGIGLQRVDMLNKEIRSSDSSVGVDNDSHVEPPVKSDQAATVIQKFIRGFLTRKMTDKLKTEVTEENLKPMKVSSKLEKQGKTEKPKGLTPQGSPNKANGDVKQKNESSGKKVSPANKIPDIPKLPILNPLTHSDLVKDELSKGLKFNHTKSSENKLNPMLGTSSGHLDSNKNEGSGEDIRISNSQYNRIMSKL